MKFLSKAKNPLLIAHNSDFDTTFVSKRLNKYSRVAVISKRVKQMIGYNNDRVKTAIEKLPKSRQDSKKFRLMFTYLRQFVKSKHEDEDKQNELFDKLANWKPVPEFIKYKNDFESADVFDTLDLVKFYFVPALRALMKVPDKKISKIAKQMIIKLKNVSKRTYKTKSVTKWKASSSLGNVTKALGVDSSSWHDAFADVMMMFDVMNKVVKYLKDNIKDISSSEEFNDIKKSMKDLADKNKRVDNDLLSIDEPIKEDQVKGGLADNMDLKDIAKKHKVSVSDISKEFKMGMKVEMEHTNDKEISKEIALDHLYEDPLYYSKLKTIEDHGMNEGIMKKILSTGAMMVASLLASANINPQQLFKQIANHEGVEKRVYTDTKGHPTIGIGFNLDARHNQEYLKKVGIDINELMNGAEIGDGVIKMLYNHSLTQAWHDVNDVVPNFKSLPTQAQMVLLDMSFNLGKSRLAGFKKMIAALQRNDFETAANEMKDSKWYHQVKSRGKALVNMMRNANDQT
jgi:GH24 family phage-related lysozyme (muramidase)